MTTTLQKTNLRSWLISRGRERSTWFGMAGLLSALGLHIDPQQIEAIAAAGVGIAGAALVFTSDV